jgi:hypothetical protein
MGVLAAFRRPAALLAISALIVFSADAAASPSRPEAQPAGPRADVPLPSGKENTAIRAQNVASSAAAIAIDFRREDGSTIEGGNEVVMGVEPAAVAAFSQVTNDALTPGFFGSAVVVADKPIETLLLREIAESTGAGSRRSWSAYGFSLPSRRLFLPLLYADTQGTRWESRMMVVNNSDFTGCFSILYRAIDGAETLEGAGSAACPNGGFEIQARGQVTLDGSSYPAAVQGKPFTAVVDSVETASAEYAEFSAYADIFRGDGGRNLGSYEAPGLGFSAVVLGADDPADGAGTTVLAPLVQNADGMHTTLIVQNASTSGTPADITVTYHASGLPGGQKAVTLSGVEDIVSLAAMDSARGLPSGTTGWAEITSTQPVVALLLIGKLGSQDFGVTSLPAAPAPGTGLEWRLPYVTRTMNALPPDFLGENSWFRVLVAGGGTANVSIRTASVPTTLCYASPQTLNVQVTGAQTFDQKAATENGWVSAPVCFSGGAIVTSDVPIVVIAGASTDVFKGDNTILYRGATP